MAYFLFKCWHERLFFVDRASVKYKKSDILKEANRILEENTLSGHSPQKKKSKRFLGWFFAGILCGGLCVLLLCTLLSLPGDNSRCC